MGSKQIDNQFAYLITSFHQFIRIFYKLYKPYIKFFALLVLAYLAFLLGRISIIDRVEQSVNNLKRLLQNRVKFTIEMPQKIKRIKKIRVILLLVTIGSSLLLIAKYYKIKILKAVSFKILIIASILIIVLLVSALIYETLLKYLIQRDRMIDLTKNEKLYALQKELGPKIQGLLKIFLCKNLFINFKEPSKYICKKQNCKKQRTLLKEREQLIQNLVLSAFNFDWCSVCRRKIPFSQYLEFRNGIFQSQSVGESQQVCLRNEYLYVQIGRMLDWIKELSPCNCSQIYWREEIAKIKVYKIKQKALQNQFMITQYKT